MAKIVGVAFLTLLVGFVMGTYWHQRQVEGIKCLTDHSTVTLYLAEYPNVMGEVFKRLGYTQDVPTDVASALLATQDILSNTNDRLYQECLAK